MSTVLDPTGANYLIRSDDGRVEMVPKSPMNQLLFEYNLWGLLRDGTEILVRDGEPASVEIAPTDGANEFSLTVDDSEPVHIGAYRKSELIETLMETYRQGDPTDNGLLVDFYEHVKATLLRDLVTGYLASQPPFADDVEETPDGWLIRDHLLLTWEGEFYHPNTTTYHLSGGTVSEGASEPAYAGLVVGDPSNITTRTIDIDGMSVELSDREIEFIAKALWAVAKAPREVR